MSEMIDVRGIFDVKDRWNMQIVKIEANETKRYTPKGLCNDEKWII